MDTDAEMDGFTSQIQASTSLEGHSMRSSLMTGRGGGRDAWYEGRERAGLQRARAGCVVPDPGQAAGGDHYAAVPVTDLLDRV